MPSDPLAYTTSDQQAALAEWINTAKEKKGTTASFTGSEPPRALWVYTGCGLPYDYATDEYGYGAPGSRTGSLMQNRVMAPITHESWYAEHNARWTGIHEKLVNYICDAASLQFRRFIGISHATAFNVTAKKLLILEAMLPRSQNVFRLWASFYSSLRFPSAPWWDPNFTALVYDCGLDNMAGTFTFFGTGGGGPDGAEKIITEGLTQGCQFNPPTPPPATPETKAHMYFDSGQITIIKTKTSSTYIPLARPGEAGTTSYVSFAYDGWFV